MESNGCIKMQAGLVRWLIIPAFFLFIGCIAKSDKMATTGTVKGILVNSSGQPIADAVVMVAGGTGSFTDMAAITDENGAFYLSNITLPGSYSLQVQTGGASVQKNVQLTSSADTIRLTY
ncbi:hypothetical protein DRJ53_14615 [Paracnuella aquatica]|nr:hypothetical protein DRJ53_14615 [Paracnuella aquatica]